MEIYNLYQMGSLIFSAFSKDYGLIFTCAIVFGLVSWLALFVLQGVGLFVMGKRREMKNKWLAFVPFVNIYYMGKLAGECGFFGHKMKNAGLYAMIAQMLGTLFTCTYILAECYLYLKHGAPQYGADAMSTPYWTGLTGFSLALSKFYDYGGFILSILSLVTQLLLLVVILGLYKKYQPRNYMVFSMLSVFIPLSRFIIVFAFRNRPAINYEDYVRAQREEYIRRRQQYGYGNPYGNPYGQGGYAGPQNGPYQPPKPDEPFEEFSSDGKQTEGEKGGSSDDFCN